MILNVKKIENYNNKYQLHCSCIALTYLNFNFVANFEGFLLACLHFAQVHPGICVRRVEPRRTLPVGEMANLGGDSFTLLLLLLLLVVLEVVLVLLLSWFSSSCSWLLLLFVFSVLLLFLDFFLDSTVSCKLFVRVDVVVVVDDVVDGMAAFLSGDGFNFLAPYSSYSPKSCIC